jgi:hypothetical protein
MGRGISSPLGTGNVHLWRSTFDTVSITSLEEQVPSHSLQPFVTAKRLVKAQRHALRRPSLDALCTVQFAPFPHDPLIIHSIAGGAQALDAFLAAEALSSTALANPSKVELRSPPIKRSSSAQTPTHNKRGTHSSPPPISRGQTWEQTPHASPARQPR